MKRLILLMYIMGAGFLVACDPTPDQQQRMDNQRTFAEAQRLLDRAVSGTIPHDADEETLGKNVDEYRREQFDAAADMLRDLANSSDESERVAARTLLAEASLNHGGAIVSRASSNATELLNTQARLLNTVTALRRAYVSYQEHDAVDLSEEAASLREEAEQLEGRREEVDAAAARIEQRIAELQAQVDERRQERRRLNEEADEVSSRAFTADGEEQFDLYVEASEIESEAGDLGSQIELLQAEIDVEQSQLALEEAEIEQIDAQVTELRNAAESLEARMDDVAELASNAAEQFDEFAAEFDRLLEALLGDYDERVEAVMVEATPYLDEAVSHLEEAARAVSGPSRSLMQVQVASARSSLGRAHAEAAAARESHRNLLLSLAEAVSDVLPDHAARMSEVAAETGEKAEEAAVEAERLLSSAAEEFAEMVEPAEARGETELHRALLQHLVVVNRSLANVTNDAAYRNRAADYRSELRSL